MHIARTEDDAAFAANIIEWREQLAMCSGSALAAGARVLRADPFDWMPPEMTGSGVMASPTRVAALPPVIRMMAANEGVTLPSKASRARLPVMACGCRWGMRQRTDPSLSYSGSPSGAQ